MLANADLLVSPLSPCPAHWGLVRLRDITTKIGSGATPRGGASTYLQSRERYALIRSQNVFDRRFDVEGLAFISDEQALKLRGAEVQAGDILLNITGDGVTFARACVAEPSTLPAVVNQHVSIIRVDPNCAVPGYILSYLTHPLIKDYIESFNTGGSRRAVTKSHIESFLVPLPPLEEQRAIAEILNSLDNKIELNRQTNQTLEQLAQRLFQSWFVDFDPVKAKLAGQAPAYMDAETAALFPDRLVESELGLIPEGWDVACLDQVVANIREGVRTEDIRSDEVYVGLEHLDRKNLCLSNWGVGGDVVSNKSRFQKEDLLFGRLRPYFHKISIAPTAGVCSTDILVLRPVTPELRLFSYLTVYQDELVSFATQTSTGTRMPRANWKTLSSFKMPVPDLLVARKFEGIAGRWIDKIMQPIEENQLLSRLRDLLLPKLISGQLRVRDAEREVEAVL